MAETSQRAGVWRLVVPVLLAVWAIAVVAIAATMATGPLTVVGVITGVLMLGLAGLAVARADWLLPVYGALSLTAGGLLAVGLMSEMPMISVAAVVGLIAIGATAPVAWASQRIVQLLERGAGGGSSDALRQIHEHVLLSDSAKRVLFRDREIQLLRSAIEEEIGRGDYDAAMRMCDDMTELFGRREQAEQFRQQILQIRHEHDEARINQALADLDGHLGARDWARAHQEAARIRRLYPDSHLLQGLEHRILRARDEHKHDLVAQLNASAASEDWGLAMRLLTELDRYMNRTEADGLTAIAERVVAGRRTTLTDNFKIAVNEHQWEAAVRLGESLLDEFPNTRAAEEVRSMIDALRTRAATPEAPAS